MAQRQKSSYNERLTFEDPCSTYSASRSTLYRRYKRVRQEECESQSYEANHQEEEADKTSSNDLQDGTDDSISIVEPDDDIDRESNSTYMYVEADPEIEDNPLLNELDYFDSDRAGELEQEQEVTTTVCTAVPTSTSAVVSNEGDRLLYECAPLTVSTSNLLVMKYKMRHNLTTEAVADLLKLLSLHCPSPNVCTPSVYHLQKSFERMKLPVTYHYYCISCLTSVTSTAVTCILCGNSLLDPDSKSYFTELSIEAQLIELFQRKFTPYIKYACMYIDMYIMAFAGDTFYSALLENYQQQRTTGHDSQYLGDLYNGHLYQDLAAQGFFTGPQNITFIMNTDGIPVFKSSKYSFWNIFLLINELPYHMRSVN